MAEVVKPFDEVEMKRKVSQAIQHSSFLRSDHLSDKSWYKRINVLNCSIVFGIPALAIYGLFTTKVFYWQTVLFAIFMYLWSGFGITAGYHRLFSHRAYKGTYILRLILMIGGSAALQGSIKFWCLLHRAHHRWTDTDKDPYNAKRGFLYAHIGWLLLDNIYVTDHVNIDDLKADSLVRWQHKHYQWFGPFMTLVFPALIAAIFWGDLRGGFYIAGAARLLFVHHSTWCVNSLAHWYGSHTFDDTISPKDNFITGLLTLGEGYHNFHHEFPSDFRNGVHWYDYDPTKWLIKICKKIGISYDLNQFPTNEIKRGEIDMKQKQLNLIKRKINYGKNVKYLPVWDQHRLQYEIKQNKRVIVIINDIAHDVTDFLKESKHPGGKKIILERNGKDATIDFNGNIYNHTNAARNLMSHFRVAKMNSYTNFIEDGPISQGLHMVHGDDQIKTKSN